MVKKSTIEDIIREDLADIWSILSSEEKHLIAENFIIHTFRKGQIIYAEKDEPQFLWCLIKGKVKRFKNGIGGKQQILRLYRPIQYFGYRAWFAREPYVASTMAIEPSQVGSIPMTVVKKLIERLSPFSFYLTSRSSSRISASALSLYLQPYIIRSHTSSV